MTAIMQPTYLPWLGYFDLIDQTDYTFVFLDDVHLELQSWQVRNKIKTTQGELYLTIPVKRTKPRNEMMICDAEINYDENWVKKHTKSIEQAYGNAPHFEEVYNYKSPITCENWRSIKDILHTEYKYLSQLTIALIEKIAWELGIRTMFRRSTFLGVEGIRQRRLINILKKVGDCEYLSPFGAKAYLDKNERGVYPRRDIKLSYHNYEHPVYPQQNGEFMSHLCILDLIFNCGFKKSLEIIRSGRRPNTNGYFYDEGIWRNENLH